MKPVALAALLLSAAAGTAFADPSRPDDPNWLQTMAFAAHQTNYSGTFVYQYGNHVEISRITHVADRSGEHSRLERLDGPRREIIRNNDEVWCYLGDRKVRVELRQGKREFPELLPEQLTLLNENYRVRQGEESRVAGFPAHTIVFQPRDNLRYIHKMWAHNDSGLLLKAAVLDERGGLVEQYTFTQLDIGGDIDRKWMTAGLPPGIFGDPHHPRDPHAAAPGLPPNPPPGQDPHLTGHLPIIGEPSPVVSGWQVEALPPGFRKIAEVRRQLPGKDAPVIQMVFSDGLAGISVFIEKADTDADDHEGLSSQGVIQAYSKVVDDQLVTVIGEVPPRTVMQVADSVRNAGGR